jgi:Kdo2-lipid IVA lauroyltransferase/acyltransferase
MSRLLTRAGLWFLRLLALLPRPFLKGLAGVLGALSYRWGHHRRRVALANLKACFPEASHEWQTKVARAHFCFYMQAFLERFSFWFGSADHVRRRVQLTGWEHFLAQEGRPIIILAPHFMGLDVGGLRLQLERRCATMYSRQSNPELDDWTVRGRGRFNDPVLIPRHKGVSTAVRWMKRGLPLYFLPDMDFGARDAVFVPFFGQPAATVTSVVRLSRLLNAAVVPLVTRITHHGYEARFYPGWDHPNDDQIETIEAGVRRMNAFIEERIRETPEQYLWTHRRFKTRPPGAPSLYA